MLIRDGGSEQDDRRRTRRKALESLSDVCVASSGERDCFGLDACLVLKHMQRVGFAKQTADELGQ